MASGRPASIIARAEPKYHARRCVQHVVITHGHVRHVALRTKVRSVGASLILRRQQDRCSGLGETSPQVLEDIAFDQSAGPLLHFEQVLGNELVPEVGRIRRVPDHRLEHVVQPYLDVAGDQGCRRTAELERFPRSFEEAVVDFTVVAWPPSAMAWASMQAPVAAVQCASVKYELMTAT